MIDLNTVIFTFSDEEKREFVSYLDRKNKRKDVKNIQLFKLIAKNEFTSKEIFTKLYGKGKKDSYHALRKRLYNSLIDFIAGTNLEEENSEKMQIIKYILVARSFLEKQQYATAYKLLAKAEDLAQLHQFYPYLNEIYHLEIQFSHSLPTLDLEILITKFKENQKLYYLEEELNIVYAKIHKILNNIVFKGEVVDFQKIIVETLEEHNISVNDSLSFKSLYQLFTIASVSAFVTKDYLQIESFVLKMYDLVQHHKNKEQQRFYHIQVLYMIANTFFRNKKFETSLTYLNLMHDEMQQNNAKYYNRFQLKYNMLRALNLNYSSKQHEAIALLEPFITKKHQDLESLLDIHLSLIVFYFQKDELKKAYGLLSKFYHTDKWYIEKAGQEWVLKKNLVEILLHLELENLDLFESRLLSFRRQYSTYLKEINQERVLTFLKLVELYYQNPEQITSKGFKSTVEKSFEWITAKREDIFVMSFYAWLKSKMEKQSLYKTTLRLIEQSQAI